MLNFFGGEAAGFGLDGDARDVELGEDIDRQSADDDGALYDQKILVMDEAWKMIRTPSCRQYVEKFIREGRKLKAVVVKPPFRK